MSLLEIKNISKENQNFKIIGNCDICVEKGEVIAIKCNKNIGNEFINIIVGQEMPSVGSILFKGVNINEDINGFVSNIGIYMDDYGVYERLKVYDYLKFFKQIFNSKCDIDNILREIGLMDKKYVKINSLTLAQKKRLNIARVFLNNPELLIFEEPFQNMDIESCALIKKIIKKYVAKGSAAIITASSLEDCISITENIFTLDEFGLKKLENESCEKDKEQNIETTFKIKKIPAKVDEKIILFNPMDVIYIESSKGNALLHTEKGEYLCMITLSDLEKRLKILGFFRNHRSYLVNLQRIKEVISWSKNSYSLILDDEKETDIPLSKGRLDELKSILGIN